MKTRGPNRDSYRRDDPDRRFLQSRLWREKLRPMQLGREPRCEFCKVLDKVVAAEHVDHIERPKGDRRLQTSFTNFRSLCATHHGMKSSWERSGKTKPLVIGTRLDGWPVTINNEQRDDYDFPVA